MGVRIAVGVPYLRSFEGYFLETMLGLSKPADTLFFKVPDKPVDLARNIIVEKVLSQPDITHVLMVDSDMILPTDALFRLVQDDKDVVSGTYFARSEQPFPHLYEFNHEDNADGTCPMDHKHEESGRWYAPMGKQFTAYLKRHPEFDERPLVTTLPPTPDALIPVEAAGAGILLIKRHVLEALSYPWFRCHERSAGGEDFFFFEKAREAGFETWGDFSVQCQHEYRGVFMDRADFQSCYHIGQEDEYDFEKAILVDMSPQERIQSEAG